MKIDILTLFPDMFKGPFDESIVKKARENKLVDINIHNLRNWAKDKHKTVDDRPYGGGKGMVMKVDVIYEAVKDLKSKNTKVILLSPKGKVFEQKKARELSKLKHIILICGHYEGVDQRVGDYIADEELSIGEYVLTGGELPSMIITDTIVRLLPGVLDEEAVLNESFSDPKKTNIKYDYAQYTRPPSFKGWKVPIVLMSGDHKKITDWRKNKS